MLLYRIFTWFYPKLAWLVGFSNPKARLWLKGRRGLFKNLSSAFYQHKKPVIWMHCASLGEFEQGLPVLSAIKTKYPGHTLLVTFFSPSGYEIRKNHPVADHIYYLPMDTPAHANRFFNIVQPSLVLFVKYEYWFYYLREAYQRNIPCLLVSGIFREDQLFFKWYGGLYRKMLGFFTQFFVQFNTSAHLLNQIGIKDNIIVSGDTRFDRVIEIAAEAGPIEVISQFCQTQQVVVAGSTWTEDDEALDHFANTHPDIRFIIAPHDIDRERLDECLQLYKHAILYSHYTTVLSSGGQLPADTNVLIIDNMGMLSRLYRYATICYVGGGFGDDGIHNVLEAAVYGKPVVFGPVYDKYFEAQELIDSGGGFSIEDSLELEACFQRLLNEPALYQEAGSGSLAYVQSKAGATVAITNYIEANRLLTN